MHEEDVKLAAKISSVAGRCPEMWQVYQDWLREIVASRAALLERYPAWQASIVFRWRLLYFVVYVVSITVFHFLLARLKRLFAAGEALKDKLLSTRDAVPSLLPSFEGYRYILQRTATLLAVSELTLCVTAALTGILLAFYYQPVAMGAHESLDMIIHQVTSGALVLSLHQVAGNGLIVLALAQIVVMYLGRDFLPTWFTGWISGILLTLTAMGLSWTAIILNWEQTGFWRFKVELSIVASIPWVGPSLRDVLSGGSGINSLTLQHMYTLHSYVLAIAAVVLSIIHLTALIYQEQHWKPIEQRFSNIGLCGESASSRKSNSV